MAERKIYWKITDIDTDSMSTWAVWTSICSFVPASKWRLDGHGNQLYSLSSACFPTYAAIAKRARCSIRTAKTAVAELEQKGYVVSYPSFSADGSRRSNRYILFPQGDADHHVRRSRGVDADDQFVEVTLPLPVEDRHVGGGDDNVEEKEIPAASFEIRY